MDRMPTETLANIMAASEDGQRLEQMDGMRRRCRSECLQISPIVHHRSNGNDFLKSTMPNGGDYYRDGSIPSNGKRNFTHMNIDHSLHHKDNIKENISMDEASGIKTNDYVDHRRYEKLQLYGEKSTRRQNYLYNLSEEDCGVGKDYYDLISIVSQDFDGQSDNKLMPKPFRDEVSKSMNGHAAAIEANCVRRTRARSESEQTEFYQVPNHHLHSAEVSIRIDLILLRADLQLHVAHARTHKMVHF